jgi:hypothetical protein
LWFIGAKGKGTRLSPPLGSSRVAIIKRPLAAVAKDFKNLTLDEV